MNARRHRRHYPNTVRQGRIRFKPIWDRYKLGYTPLPSLLLKAQAKLKLRPVLLNVLLQVIEHWFDADEDPFPTKNSIARRLRRTPRQIQRVLTELEKDGFIKRVPRYSTHRQQTSNAYSLDGTVEKLKSLEPEFRKAKEQNRIRTSKVESGGADCSKREVEVADSGVRRDHGEITGPSEKYMIQMQIGYVHHMSTSPHVVGAIFS